MEFIDFAKNAVLLDKRNTFAKFNGDISLIPEEMKAFYQEVNPLDVEVGFVRFTRAEELADLQSEYAYLGTPFVFATSNGDPIFLKEGHVYTCPHGIKKPQHELLSEDIKSYLASLIEDAM